jgi:hypothetical protein
MGVGDHTYAVALVTTAFTDGSSDSTLEVKLQSDNDVAFGSVDSEQILGTFSALAAAGSKLVAQLQVDKINSRYLRGYYTPANGNLTTGAVSLFLVKDIDAITAYANGYTIA